MKVACYFIKIVMIFMLFQSFATAEDMRQLSIEAKQKRDAVMQKAMAESKKAIDDAKDSHQKILSDKKALISAINKLKNKIKAEKKRNLALIKENEIDEKCKIELDVILSKRKQMVNELIGYIRITAKDLNSLIKRSIHTALYPDHLEIIKPILSTSTLPGMESVRKMTDLLFSLVKLSGEVSIQEGSIVDRAGKGTKAKVLTVGNFTAAYQLKDKNNPETGYLIFSDKSCRFFALSKLPKSSITKSLKRYMEGNSEVMPLDISNGAALRQIIHKSSLKKQIQTGGPLVWPILGVGLFAMIIIIERLFFLKRANINADKMIGRVNQLAGEQKWDDCLTFCYDKKSRPVPRILLAGIKNKDMCREDMENVLQEAILSEIPPLERFLSTLGMLAAISPLLGLLGTVTGMINTFNTITYYGTSDPKMMSGGISEALTTTMLGLGVAIPIMLFHTYLSRNVESLIAQMEEKAVAFTNTVFSTKAK